MDYQVAIIGAGPAGLAAALTLSRSLMRSVVVDSAQPARNASSPFVAALPGLEKTSPSELRETVRRDILSYPYAEFLESEVTGIRRLQEGFEVLIGEEQKLQAGVVLLATGMRDLLPPLKGLSACWGHTIINCPFCHGIEWQSRRWGIYAHRPEVVDAAEIYRNWTSQLIYFLGSTASPTAARRQTLSKLCSAVEDSLPVRVHHEDGAITHAEMPDGRLIELDCLLVYPHQTQCDLMSGLNLSLTDAGYIEVDEGFRTSEAGIYAAGDLTYPGHQNTPTAFHMGNMAAATIVMDNCFKT
ncbi:NAD(P)/FAD-dependent oxidoreductase [Roseibium sp. HPY-6]|uniref:NAD(P)/FAD-dependent oxidoreductase n=1 Tax=Roseibium sp. HPY-6 TaxID=3229852 RepID=UPI00338E8EC4